MKPSDVFLAVLVAVIWGLGFVATRLALNELAEALAKHGMVIHKKNSVFLWGLLVHDNSFSVFWFFSSDL